MKLRIGYKKFRYPFVAKGLTLGNFFKGILLFIAEYSGDADFYPNYNDMLVKIAIYHDILGRNLLIKQSHFMEQRIFEGYYSSD